ncbi:DUF6382 domain-containing protein [Paenibacillus sp. UNC451MF]|uniref:DUF6382 domain-containing protein n=1 Tax=Paenibacillus sp. UNC451MF TaxID=1449063 RepID=UPI00048A5AA8|nr:DUF6382 domain-containing protein [Paenibacillus sp. UNC451MF]
MNQMVYGLQVDYQNQNGHFMVMYKENGLHKEDISSFQLNMLLMNRIPRLLELHVEEVDQNLKLYYSITDKRMLSQWLRLGSLSIKQFFTLLYTLVDVLSESSVYMLQEGRYILKEDYIYCGKDLTDIYITYLPMESLTDKNTVSVDLQHLASRLVHKVSELSGSGYQELMNYLMDESFHLAALKQLLLKHMNQLGNDANVVQKENARSKDFVSNYPREYDTPQEQSASPDLLKQSTVVSTWSTITSQALSNPVMSDKSLPQVGSVQLPFPSPFSLAAGTNMSNDQASNKLKLPVMLAGILSLCLVWKLYLDHPLESWVYICSGLSLLIADLVFVILWIWKPYGIKQDPNDLPEEKKGKPSEDNPVPEAILARLASKSTLEPSSSLAAFFKVEAQEAASSEKPLKQQLETNGNRVAMSTNVSKAADNDSEAYYRGLEQRTTLLPKSDATVLLHSSMRPVTSAYPYLETNQSGASAKISLVKPCFVIGRAGEGVDYEHKETGVSRLHAEIVRENGVYGVKDLGSRNGTFVNNELLTPYRVYCLNDGDIVRIINTEFIFKMGL